ncbi:MAG: CNNM domain-containing protein [Planctomycetota bacterium]
MIGTWEIVALCGVGVMGSALFSGVETGAYRFNRTRHRIRVAEESRAAKLVSALTGDMTSFVIVCLIGTNLFNVLVSFSTTAFLESLQLGNPELVATLTVAPLLFLLGEVAPKELFRRHPNRLLYAFAPPVAVFAFLCRPATWLLRQVTRLLRLFGLNPDDDERGLLAQQRLRQAISAGAAGGTLTDYQERLAGNIFSLHGRTAEHVMVPLRDLDTIEVSTELEAAQGYVRQRGRTRYPVYKNRVDAVVGVITLYDLLFEERPGLTVRNYVEDVLRVPPDEGVAQVLLRMRQARSKLAVVERGGQALGIVTLKDLVEEITGELADF